MTWFETALLNDLKHLEYMYHYMHWDMFARFGVGLREDDSYIWISVDKAKANTSEFCQNQTLGGS